MCCAVLCCVVLCCAVRVGNANGWGVGGLMLVLVLVFCVLAGFLMRF